MYIISGNCPVCQDKMRLERLRCRRCGTVLEGSFELSPLFELEPDQLHFVELLVKYRGNIQKVAEELGVSYRTGRNRMDEISAALGYDVPEEPPGVSAERRLEILESLQAGEFNARRAIRLLRGEGEEE